jgi:hypothetical protein
MFSKLFRRAGKTPSDPDPILLDGAYRLHRAADIGHFTHLARTAFPTFADRIECFGADWLGRQFANDRGRMASGEPLVLMLEPGTGEALEIPASFTAFHEHELIEESDAVAAFPFYQEWLSAGGARPRYDQCIGYKVPLFLGGADGVANLEVSDFDVYWTMSAQLLAQVRGIPDGAVINRVSISD